MKPEYFTSDTLIEITTFRDYENPSDWEHHMAIYRMPNGNIVDVIFDVEHECSPYIYQNEFYEAPDESPVTEVKILEVREEGDPIEINQDLLSHLKEFWLNEELSVL